MAQLAQYRQSGKQIEWDEWSGVEEYGQRSNTQKYLRKPVDRYLSEILRRNELIQIHFGNGFERVFYEVGSDIGVVRKEHRLASDIQGGMVLTTGMPMFGILVLVVRACGAVIAGNNVEDLYAVGSKMPRFFGCMCYSKQCIGGQIEQKDRDDERKNKSIF